MRRVQRLPEAGLRIGLRRLRHRGRRNRNMAFHIPQTVVRGLKI